MRVQGSIATVGWARESRVTIAPHRPSIRELLFFFMSGILISVPFSLFFEVIERRFLYGVLPVFYAVFFSVAILTPLIEEFAKAYPLFYRHSETGRSIFKIGFLIGLGFGISEFLLYVIVRDTPVLIRLPGMFFHAASTSITAYGISAKRPGRYYLIATLLHFLNNFSAFLGPFWFIGGIGATVAAYSISWRLYHITSDFHAL